MNGLVTGVAGFIGAPLAEVLLDCGDNVIGIDNLSEYYDVNLKLSRLAEIEKLQKLANLGGRHGATLKK